MKSLVTYLPPCACAKFCAHPHVYFNATRMHLQFCKCTRQESPDSRASSISNALNSFHSSVTLPQLQCQWSHKETAHSRCAHCASSWKLDDDGNYGGKQMIWSSMTWLRSTLESSERNTPKPNITTSVFQQLSTPGQFQPSNENCRLRLSFACRMLFFSFPLWKPVCSACCSIDSKETSRYEISAGVDSPQSWSPRAMKP